MASISLMHQHTVFKAIFLENAHFYLNELIFCLDIDTLIIEENNNLISQ